jgi:hypothetical protein
MTLAEQIELAHQQNEKRIASEVGIPKLEQDTEALMLLRHWVEWAKQRGVRYMPCAPASAAAFIRAESAVGVPAERIVRTLEAIQAMHDNAGLANPIATAPVRAELSRILKLDGPRSWSRSERLLLATVPAEVRAVIERRSKADSDLIRKLQNENYRLRTLNPNQKEIDSHESSITQTT